MNTKEILQEFQFERVLSNDLKGKLVFVLGKVKEDHCVLSFEKTQFEREQLPELPRKLGELKEEIENNIYRWAMGQVTNDELRVKVIYPATKVHIDKYEAQKRVLLRETPEDYSQLTLPYIQSIPASRTQWVQNILIGAAETERVIYQDSNMILLPDMKWDGTQENLYWVVLFKEPLRSLRCLGKEHVKLLENVREECYRLLIDKANLSPNQVRLFFHYPPSYYHLHLHVTALSFGDAPGVVSGQAHLLDTIIDNLRLYPKYYQQATLPFLIGENTALAVTFEEAVLKPK